MLAEDVGIHGATQCRAAQQAKADRNPHQAPVRLLMLVDMPGELTDKTACRAQANQSSIQKGHHHAMPACSGIQIRDLCSLQTKGFVQKSQWQSLTGIAIGACRPGFDLSGESPAQGIGAARAGIIQDCLQGVIVVKTLKEQVPEGYQRVEDGRRNLRT